MSSHGKKTRNPGYDAGNNWVTCDRCGFVVYAAEALHTWDGLVVCEEDYEPRHEQDFVRSRKDKISADVVRPVPTDVDGSPTVRSAISGVAVAGQAMAGYGTTTSLVPSGTFNTNTL